MSEWHPEDGSTFDEFENPVWRHRFLKDATPEQLQKIRDEFASGNWSVFGVFARAILDGKLKPEIPDTDYHPPPRPVERDDDYPQPALTLDAPVRRPVQVPGTPEKQISAGRPQPGKLPPAGKEPAPAPGPTKLPHAVFWADFFKKASETERREFLEFLLRAQMAHRPVKHRQMRWKLSGFSPACRRALLDYLNIFQSPCHVPDPMTLTGGRMPRYGHVPDERMVHLAGMFGIGEALPALGKLLGMRRRMFQLHSDFCTSPNEVDKLQSESVLAVVRIGLAGAKDKALDILKSAIVKGTERIWFEIYSDGHRGGASRRVEDRELEEHGMMGRNQLLESGIAAIRKGGEHLRNLEWPDILDPKFSWVMKENEGAGHIRDGTLYYQSTSITNIIDLASGRTIVRFDTGQTNASLGVACYYQVTAVDTEGDFVLVTQIIPLSSGNGRHWEAVTVDRWSGEVKKTFELAVQPERAYGPAIWPQADGGIVFHHEQKVWKQAADGKLLWKHETSSQETVRCTGGVVGILTKKDFCIRRAGDFSIILEMDLGKFHAEVKGDNSEPPEMREELVLLDDRFYVFPRWEGPMLAYDFKGKLLWKKKPEQGGYWLDSPRALGKGLLGRIYDYIYTVSETGELKWFEKPSGMEDHFLSGPRGVFMKANGGIHYRAFDGDKTRTPLPDLTFQSRLVSLNEEYFIFNFFDREWHLVCLPKEKW